jgi:hypothetical protein
LIPTGIAAFSIKQPDVCLYDTLRVNTSILETVVMYVSYIEASTGDIIVQEERWPNINNSAVGNPIINYTQLWNYTPTASVNAIRIAVANSTASRYDMTVVAEGTIAGNINIIAYNYTTAGGAGLTARNYTNGTFSGFNTINAARNSKPVVTYEKSGNNLLYVAWNYDNSSNTYGAGYHPGDKLPVGLQCTIGGIPTTSSGYWDVPSTISSDQNIVSICGRNAGSDIGLSFYDNNPGTLDIYSKFVTNPTSNFKTSHSIKSDNISNTIFITVMDLQGRIILKNSIEQIDKIEFINNLDLRSGIYFLLEMKSDKTKQISKFVKS